MSDRPPPAAGSALDPPLDPGTTAVHAGERGSEPRRPAVVPIYQTAPFVFASADELAAAFAAASPRGGELGGLYSRYANPTVRVVEEKIAALEGGQDAVAFSSGMAAISGVLLALLRSGDRLLAAEEVYGGTHSWLQWLTAHHPEVVVERLPLARLEERLAGGPGLDLRVVYVETPTNPLLACADLAALAAHTRLRGIKLVVDSTFATPVLQRPLGQGADLVVHSATKFLGGHSDVTAGLVVGASPLIAAVREVMMWGGACLDPHAAFLLGRGMKTLALRVERQSANAARLAGFLQGHPEVSRVHYAGLDPIGRRQMTAGGGVLAAELAGGPAAVAAFLGALRLFQIIPSLGGVESGVLHPASTSHRQLAPEARAKLGISEGLLRLSCGIEAGEDLERDLDQALRAVRAAAGLRPAPAASG